MDEDRVDHTNADLRESLAVLRRRKLVIAGTTVLLVLSALAFSSLQTPRYTASTRVLVQPIPTGGAGSSTAAPLPPINLETEREIVASSPVAARVREEIGTSLSTDELLGRLSVEGILETEVLVVSFNDPDPERAQQSADAFAQEYIEFRRSQVRGVLSEAAQSLRESITGLNDRIADLTERIGEAREDGEQSLASALRAQRNSAFARLGVQEQRLQDVQPDRMIRLSGGQVIEPATLPERPTSPDYLQNAGLALVLGIGVGVGFALLKDRLDDRFRSRRDVERALEIPVLAAIPRFGASKRQLADALIADIEPHGAASEAYRALRTNLEFNALQRRIKSIVVTSPASAEGKTVTVANLAVSLVQAGRVVVLVSADMRRPTLERYFRIDNRSGLSTFLLSQVRTAAEFVQDSGIPNLGVVACGPVPPNPAELLTSARLTDLLNALEAGADFVLLDAPPTLAVADTSILASQAGGTLLIVNQSQTLRSAAVRAQEELRRVGANIIGVVLNAFDPSEAPYDYEIYRYRPQASADELGEGAATDGSESRSDSRRARRGKTI